MVMRYVVSTPVVAGTAALMKSVAPEIGRWRLGRMIVWSSQRARIAVSHGRLNAARAVYLAWTAAQEDEGETDSP